MWVVQVSMGQLIILYSKGVAGLYIVLRISLPRYSIISHEYPNMYPEARIHRGTKQRSKVS